MRWLKALLGRRPETVDEQWEAHRCSNCGVDHTGQPCPLDEQHVVVRINDHYYRCTVCGQAGSERWAILHQWPPKRGVTGVDHERTEG